MAANLSHSRAEGFLGLWAATFAVSTFVLLTRLGVRVTMQHFGPEDWLITGAGAVNVVFFVCGVLQTHGGIGKHMATLSASQIVQAMKWSKIGTAVSLLLLMAVKLSIGAQLHRLGLTRRWKLVLWTTLGVYSCITIFTMATYIWRCSPVRSLWEPMPASEVKCVFALVSWRNVSFVQIGLSLLTDILLSLVPAVMLFRLQAMKLNTKIVLAILFALGLIASVAGMAKLYYLVGFGDKARLDFTYNIVFANAAAVVECEIALIAACVPPIRPLFTRFHQLSDRWKSIGRFLGSWIHFKPSRSTASSNSASGGLYAPHGEHEDGQHEDIESGSEKYLSSPSQSSQSATSSVIPKTVRTNGAAPDGEPTVVEH